MEKQMKGIACCGDCVYYSMKRHCCTRGCKDEGKAQDAFYADCPLPDVFLLKEGEWLEVGFGKPDAWDCSICGAMVGRKSLFCPGCGAKMKNGSRAVNCYERNNLINVENSEKGS